MQLKYTTHFHVVISERADLHGPAVTDFVQNIQKNGGALVNTQYSAAVWAEDNFTSAMHYTQVHYLMPVKTASKKKAVK